MTQTFREWLERHEKKDTPIGDLARDAKRDRARLGEWTTPDELRTKIAGRACFEAMQTLSVAERRWFKQQGMQQVGAVLGREGTGRWEGAEDLGDGSIALAPPPPPHRSRPPSETLKLRKGWIYVIEARTGPMKIGFTSSPMQRALEIARGTGDAVTLHAVREGTMYDEAMLHRRFQRYALTGEWFFPTTEFEALLAEPGWISGVDIAFGDSESDQ